MAENGGRNYHAEFTSRKNLLLTAANCTGTVFSVVFNFVKGAVDISRGRYWAGGIGLGVFYIAGIICLIYGAAEWIKRGSRKKEYDDCKTVGAVAETASLSSTKEFPMLTIYCCYDEEDGFIERLVRPFFIWIFILCCLSFPFLFSPLAFIIYLHKYLKMRKIPYDLARYPHLSISLLRLQAFERFLLEIAKFEAILISAPQTILQMYLLQEQSNPQNASENVLGIAAILGSLVIMSLIIQGTWAAEIDPYKCNISEVPRDAVIYFEAASLVCLRTTVLTAFLVTLERHVTAGSTFFAIAITFGVLLIPRLVIFISHFLRVIYAKDGDGSVLSTSFKYHEKWQYFFRLFGYIVFESLMLYPIKDNRWIPVCMDCETITIALSCFFLRTGKTPEWLIRLMIIVGAVTFSLNQYLRFYRFSLFPDNTPPVPHPKSSPIRLFRTCQKLVKESEEVLVVDDNETTLRWNIDTDTYSRTTHLLSRIIEWMELNQVPIDNLEQELEWPMPKKLVVLAEFRSQYGFYKHLSRLPVHHQIVDAGRSLTFSATPTYLEVLVRVMERSCLLVLANCVDLCEKGGKEETKVLINLYYKVFLYCRSVFINPPFLMLKFSPEIHFDKNKIQKTYPTQYENLVEKLWPYFTQGDSNHVGKVVEEVQAIEFWRKMPSLRRNRSIEEEQENNQE